MIFFSILFFPKEKLNEKIFSNHILPLLFSRLVHFGNNFYYCCKIGNFLILNYSEHLFHFSFSFWSWFDFFWSWSQKRISLFQKMFFYKEGIFRLTSNQINAIESNTPPSICLSDRQQIKRIIILSFGRSVRKWRMLEEA